MIVVLQKGCTQACLDEVLAELERLELEGHRLQGGDRTLIHVTGGDTRRARGLRLLEQVEGLVPTSGPRIRRRGRRFYPYHFIRWSAAGVLLFGLLVFLAGQLPPGIGADIDATVTPERVAFPWFVAPVVRFVGWFPDSLAWLGWTLFWSLAGALLVLPTLDRTRGRPLRERWWVVAAGLALFGAVLAAAFVGGGS